MDIDQAILIYVHLAIPILIICTLIFTNTVRQFIIKKRTGIGYEPLLELLEIPKQGTSKSALYWLVILITSTFVGNAIVIISRALMDHEWSPTPDVAFATGGAIIWGLILVIMIWRDQIKNQAIGGWDWTLVTTWWIAFLLEMMRAFLSAAARKENNYYTTSNNILSILRFLLIFGLLWVNHFVKVDISQTWNTSSLESGSGSGSGNGIAYGTFNQQSERSSLPKSTDVIKTPPSIEKQNLREYLKKFKIILPSLIPRGFWLQLCLILSFTLLILGRIVILLTPQELGKVTDELAQPNPKMPWKHLLLYITLQYIGSSSGLLSALQNLLWIPVSQYTARMLQLQVFEHLHTLSLSYHLQRKTGEVIRVVDRGSGITNLLQTIAFSILPVIADILLAVIYFTFKFDIWFGFFIFVTMAVYLFITVTLTNWRTKFRREIVELDNDARSKMTDSLLNFETVKYYTAEAFELQRYATAIKKSQRAELKTIASLNLLNMSQAFVITMGLLGGCMVAAYRVTIGIMTVGDFVLFITYLNQLIRPLNWIGTYYRMINQYFIDTEKMVDLLAQNPSVTDKPDAVDLHVERGEIIFDHVNFSYDPRTSALKDISFRVAPGSTIALVGESGGGKTSILRLLFRFYDVDSGKITIDGQDIRDIKQKSLRSQIGVVPQDSVLANDTIAYNIGYGKLDENIPFEIIESAAKAAQIHDKIMSWPDKYETKVGERGLRLSGGEKQRTAIARTMVKNPPIILLDEATSALDTTTERQIQHALSALSVGRTTLVVAHRLSTVVNADMILVIQGGRIIEQGSHNELFENTKGVYYDMWMKQMQDTETLIDNSATISSRSSIKSQNQIKS